VAAALMAVALAGGGVVAWHHVWAASWPPPNWAFAVCQAAQGAALVVRTDATSAILINAGPDAAALQTCLDQLDVRELPLVLLSGFAAADIDGLLGAFADRRVGVVASATSPPASASDDRLTATLAANGAELSTTSVGDHGVLGTASWQILGPMRSYSGTGADQANDSLVVRFTVAGVSMLVIGDVAAAAESDLLSAGLPPVDVLVASQHAAQDPDFVAMLRPEVTIDGPGSVAITDVDGRVKAVRERGH
jgi:competence protein ComEC